MPLLERYIAGAIIRTTAITILVLVILLVFFNFVDELDHVGEADYLAKDAFVVALLTAPRYMFEVFPIAALIGSLLGLGGLASHSEIVAMRAAGFTRRRIVMAVVKIGFVLMLVALAFGELVAPPSEQYAQQLRAEKLQGQTVLKSRYGFWVRDGDTFINIRSIASERFLRDIYIYTLNADLELVQSRYAESAKFADGQWQLANIAETNIHENGVETRHIAAEPWSSTLNPALLSVAVVRPTMLPIWGLQQYITFLSSNGQSAVEYQVAFWLKVANPVATVVMLFLAVPFVLGNQRNGSMGQRIFVGILIGSSFFLLNRAMSYVAVVYELNPLLAAILPASAFLALATMMMRRVR